MNQLKINKLDYLIIFGLILIILVGIFLISYYFNNTKEVCISNPLVFGIKQLEEGSGVEIIGMLTVKDHPEIIINFDRNNLSIINTLSPNFKLEEIEFNLSEKIKK